MTSAENHAQRGNTMPNGEIDATPSVAIAALREVDKSSRLKLRFLALAAGAGALLLQLSNHRHALHWITTALAAATAVYAMGVEIHAYRGREAHPLHTLVAGVLCASAALAAIAYLSPVSSAGAALCVLVFSWALGGSRQVAWGVYLTSAIGYLVVVTLSLVGVLPLTQTEMPLSYEHARGLVGLGVFLEILLADCMFVGRRTRAALDAALRRAEQAQYEILRRGALLNEARAELRNVLDAGKLGPLSGREVGPYLLGEVIGRGGMGEVYRGTHRQTGKPGAIKVLHAASRESDVDVQRFLREAEVSSALDSPHIVKVLENGTTPDGVPYLAMELLEGVDLGRYLVKQNRLDLAETVELVRQLSRALTMSERADIVHRDIKPQNVFRVDAGTAALWKLLDFGVSKLRETSGTLTQGAAVGTPSYMSPEQVAGLSVDQRSDVFSLGAIAYRALTGRPAFDGSDHLAIMYKVHSQQPHRPSDFAEVHADVDLVMALVLAKDREQRFESASDFADALENAAQGELSGPLRSRARAVLAEWPWKSGAPSDVTIDES